MADASAGTETGLPAVFDSRPSELGEGPLWHPARGQLFWFDIPEGRLLSRDETGPLAWALPEPCSAAGWVDDDTLILGGESRLWRFDLRRGSATPLTVLNEDPALRSNDGRADPWGGFWISTMEKGGAPDSGAIWRWHGGELRRLVEGLTTPNAICFVGDHALYADTPRHRVWRLPLDGAGWPAGPARPWLDLSDQGLNPDGAVIDADGLFWCALWGKGRVAAFDEDGAVVRTVAFDAPNVTCPAFGGPDLTTLYVTTALEGMDDDARAAAPRAGMVQAVDGAGRGRAEPAVTL